MDAIPSFAPCNTSKRLGSFRNFADSSFGSCGGYDILPFPGEHGGWGGEDPVTSKELRDGELLRFASRVRCRMAFIVGVGDHAAGGASSNDDEWIEFLEHWFRSAPVAAATEILQIGFDGFQHFG